MSDILDKSLHPVYLKDRPLLVEELQRRAKGYTGELRRILLTAAHLLKPKPGKRNPVTKEYPTEPGRFSGTDSAP